MVVSIEVAVGYLVKHALPGIVVQHQAPEDGLLSLDGVRRYLEGGGLQVELFRDGDLVHRLGKFLGWKDIGHVIACAMTCPMLASRHLSASSLRRLA
ncbi:hypothetical protein D9M72_311470 [compost metagenome]